MAIPVSEGLDRLQDLHRDLVSLNESRLPNIERLLALLEAHLEDFQKLLEKPARNDKSRQALSSGTLQIGDLEYSLNEDFKQETIQLSDFLDLDEVEAAKLYMRGQEDAQRLDRSPLASSIISFHERRQFLAECVRLVLQYSSSLPSNTQTTSLDPVQQFVDLVFETKDGKPQTRAVYWRNCMTFMTEIEKWLNQIVERIQSMAMTGQVQSLEFTEIMEYQARSLHKQHESLAAIEYLLPAIEFDDLRSLLSRIKTLDRYDAILIHYIPVLASAIQQFAAPQNCLLEDAKTLHGIILATNEQNHWSLRSFQALAKVLWLPCYSSRFQDAQGLPLNTEDVEGPEKRSALFMEALRDGAFQFMLSISRDIRDDAWFDPLRHGITDFLTHDAPALHTDSFPTEIFFQQILMEPLTLFVQDFISFMPDTLRKLKVEEDEQRRQMSGLAQLHPADQGLDLERFLIVIAYAYEGFQENAEVFYERAGNLFGFLQWASQRQSTPRVAAFCEMLRTLSESEACADLAHSFLVNEGASMVGRSRKGSTLSWNHIFNELEFYSSTIRQKPALQHAGAQMELVEPESTMMLECYLRLLSHFSKKSPIARHWILNHPSFKVQENLFFLCGSSIASRLRACSFSALNALLTQKDRRIRDSMWVALDSWISGTSPASAQLTRANQPLQPFSINEQLILESICTGFEEPNSVVELLQGLISPMEDEIELGDSLPFPESLGNAYRMPGIDPYVDLVLGRVFAAKSVELQDPIQLRLIRWNCLNFAATCLSTFNEDLVLFANRSSVSVDSAINTTSLASYIKIHPFARVMEWFFHESVIAALFATIQQNMQDVNDSSAFSPLVLSVMRSIEVIDLILKLQSTYFDIVRPIVKIQSANRPHTVANSALASFEDAILNNITAVAQVGLFCGSGHRDLVISSINLMQRLCGLRKLNAPLTGGGRKLWERSRLIAVLERNNEAESISRALIAAMLPDEAEFEQGSTAPGLTIKEHLLKFLNESLVAVGVRPTVAHLLLGFQCHSHTLDVANDSLFASGRSLFHALVKFLMECPIFNQNTMLSWSIALSNETLQILAKLWRSPMSAHVVLQELRLSEFLFMQWLQLPVIGQDTLWDSRTTDDPEFFLSSSAVSYANFLHQRNAVFEYAATELRSVDTSGLMTLRTRIRSMLLGSLSFADGSQIPCVTLFDLVDFLRLDANEQLHLPESKFFNLGDLGLCKETQGTHTKYNIRIAQQLLQLRQNELRSQGQLSNGAAEKQIQADSYNILQCIHANNSRADIQTAQIAALDSWVKLIIVFLDNSDLDVTQRNGFIGQGLQVMLPQFERSLMGNLDVSVILAHFGRALLSHSDLSAMPLGASIAHDPGNDKLFRLFCISLTGLQNSESTAALRTSCHIICHDYLHQISQSAAYAPLSRHVLHFVNSLGIRLIETICEDAYAGEGLCRTSALLLLGGIVAFSNQADSRDVVGSLARLNFIQIMVNNIKTMSQELQEVEDTAQLLLYQKANLALLLRIAQTRSGAAHIMSGGLFDSVRKSGLFSTDPDIGLEIDNPRALTTYFQLLLAVLQIINAVVLSRGPQNDQTISEARQFLQDNRPSTVAVFKRNAKIGVAGAPSKVADENEIVVMELVDNFTMLISATDFLATEEEKLKQASAPRLYS